MNHQANWPWRSDLLRLGAMHVVLPVPEGFIVRIASDDERPAVVGGPASLVDGDLRDEVTIQPQRHVSRGAVGIQRVEVARRHGRSRHV